MSVRVRYAPSPTGSPHVGNIRTGLFDYLLARRHGGTMIFRLEDTDRARAVAGSEEENRESLRWLGVTWQEGPDVGGPFAPYRQSERAEAGIYARWVDRLIEAGHAYWAFDTPEELAAMRERQLAEKKAVGYFDGPWRDASAAEVERARREGRPGVIRLRIPRGRTLVVHDAIRGRIEFDSDQVDDPVLIKADGMPTYHCAAMIDDHLMEITHVIRGEEWISSAPKHAFLYEAFGWTPPIWVHVPVINGKDGRKLSKRHGDTACLDFRRAGYLPEALANFIALIGWSPGGDREIMSLDEMAEAFSIEGIQPSPGVFDLEKLRWMNGHYIRSQAPEDLAERVRSYAREPETARYWATHDPEGIVLPLLGRLAEAIEREPQYGRRIVELEQPRVTTLADFAREGAFFLVEEPAMEPAAVRKWFGEPHVADLFAFLLDRLAEGSRPTEEVCERWLREFQERAGLDKLGPVVHPVRVALTGRTTGPGLFELMAALGTERMRVRLRRALALLNHERGGHPVPDGGMPS